MSNELQTTLDNILNDKNTNLLPENLKKDIICLGVTGALEEGVDTSDATATAEDIVKGKTAYVNGEKIEGTYEGEGSSTSNLKIFKTEEEMQADETAKEGDLAVVYESKVQNWDGASAISTLIFPKTVVLPEVATGTCRGYAESGSTWINIQGDVTSTEANFYIQGDTIVEITYTSEDGLTYTRTDSNDETITITDEPVTVSMMEWADTCGYFMQVDGCNFGGLFSYCINVDDTSTLAFPLLSSITANNEVLTFGGEFKEFTKIDALKQLILKIKEEENYTSSYIPSLYYKDDVLYAAGRTANSGTDFTGLSLLYDIDTDKYYLSQSSSNSDAIVYTLDVDNQIYSKTTVERYTTENTAPLYISYDIAIDTSPISFGYGYGAYSAELYGITVVSTVNSTTYYPINNPTINLNLTPYKQINEYCTAPTQLSVTPDYVYEKEFYGKDGVFKGNLQKTNNLTLEQLQLKVKIYNLFNELHISDTSLYGTFSDKTDMELVPKLDIPNATYTAYMFNNCSAIEEVTIVDVSNISTCNYMFNKCTSLRTVTDESGKGFSSLTDASYMYNGCANLVSVPNFTSNKATDYDRAFQGCTSLVNAPECDFSVTKYTNGMYAECTSLVSVPNYDLSKVTWVNAMFSGCTSLVTVPQFTISTAEYVQAMFKNCPNLSNDSLNNILSMCTTVPSTFSQDKTLKQIGLSEEQAEICTTLSNYQVFLDAGWTTGY